jgi:hypothetical protein
MTTTKMLFQEQTHKVALMPFISHNVSLRKLKSEMFMPLKFYQFNSISKGKSLKKLTIGMIEV